LHNRELDELEREDFTRLKKVQANKAVAAAVEKVRQNEMMAVTAAAEALDIKAGLPLKSASVEPTSAPAMKAEVSSTATEESSSSSFFDGYDAADDEDVVFK
jgi:nucleoid-associated protein YgaU